MEDLPTVADDTEAHRFVLTATDPVSGAELEAELTYRVEGDRLVLVHTSVPDQLGGRGIGGQLVRAAVSRAQRAGEILAPWCEFARAWLEGHPDVASSVVVDWSPPPGQP